MKNNVCIIVFFIASISAVPVYAVNNTVYFRNAKTAGMGDTRVAGGYSYNGFIDNPALLSRVKMFRFSLARMPVTGNNHLNEVSNFIYYNKYNIENFDNLKEEGKEIFLDAFSDYEGDWGYLNVAPMFDFSMKVKNQGFGIAAYSIHEIGLKTGRVDKQPAVWGRGYAKTVIVAGYSRPVDFILPGFTGGINIKYIERQRVSMFRLKTADIGNLNKIFNSISDEFRVKRKTMAVDIGLLGTVPLLKSDVGVTVQSIGDGPGASIDAGIAKKVLWDTVLLIADYRDIGDNNRESVLDKFHLGAEFSYDVFAVRAGLSEGHTTFGFGLDFKIVDLDFAVYTKNIAAPSGIMEDRRMQGQMQIGW